MKNHIKNKQLLKLLALLSSSFQTGGLEVIVTGGLGISGFLGRQYREFYDLDITVVGKEKPEEGLKSCKEVVSSLGGEIVYADDSYFQSKLKGFQVDIVYVQDVSKDGKIIYKTSKGKIAGSEELLKPLVVWLERFEYKIFRPEVAIVEKLVGSLTLNLIRDKDVKDLEMVIDKLNPRLMFEAMRVKFSFKENKCDNTGF
ncbi:MAG: hypothetical protein ABIE03_02855 [Patescibacteria group bacterium]|nr:hypothetical protein [Patescibacteria group bacterium]